MAMLSSGDAGSGEVEEELGRILNEIIDRKRDGESPTAEEYAARFPHLRLKIESHLRTMDLLDRIGGARRGAARSRQEEELAAALSALPEGLQRAIFLRHSEGKRWEEIARELGQTEEALRRSYARAVLDLLRQKGRGGAG